MIAANLFDFIGLAPALPGAKCRGRHATFDEAAVGEDPAVVEQRHGQAIELCQRCPALDRCAEWFDSLPRRKRPVGVVAARINPAPAGRPRKAS